MINCKEVIVIRYEIKQEACSSDYGEESWRRITMKEYLLDVVRIGFLGPFQTDLELTNIVGYFNILLFYVWMRWITTTVLRNSN